MRKSWSFWAAGLLTVAWIGCGESDKVVEDAERLELFTYWLGDGNNGPNSFSYRLQVLLNHFTDKYPNVTIVNGVAHWEGGDYESGLADRFEKLAPPDVFQLNASSKMFEHVASGWLEPIGDIWTDAALAVGFGPQTKESMMVDGKIYGIPVNIQRDNVIFYNKKVFSDAGVDSATITKLKSGAATLDDLFAVAETVKQFYDGDPTRNGTPFALFRSVNDKTSTNPGDKYPWTLKDAFIDCILPGTIGVTAWKKLSASQGTIAPADWKTSGVQQAFRNLKRFIDYANPDFLEDCENLADDQKCSGEVSPWHTVIKPQGSQNREAAMTQIGDWYVGSFKGEDKMHGTDWDYFVCPGVGSLYLAHTDVFVLSDGAPNASNARDFLSIMSDPKAQATFNAINGTIPARGDAEVTEAAGFDGYAQAARADLAQNGFTWRTEAGFSKEFRESYIGPIGEFATAVLKLKASDAAIEPAVETATKAMADLCVQMQFCATPQ